MALQKIIRAATLLLAGVCLAAPITGARAEAGTNIYSVDGEYEVTIPAEVTVDTDSKAGALAIEGTLGGYHNLDISITSENNFQLVNSGSKIDYTISSYSVHFSNDKSPVDTGIHASLDINVTGEAYVSGEYKDTLTFTMSSSEYVPGSGEHMLTFNQNCEGDVTMAYVKKYLQEGCAYGELPVPERDGYTFMGWYTEAAAGTEVTADTVMKAADAVVYAHWKENVLTINYHNDGAQSWLSYSSSTSMDIDSDAVAESEAVGYAGKYYHSDYGLLDVGRFTKAGYHTGLRWKIGSPTSSVTVADTVEGLSPYGTDGAAVAKLLGVLEEFKKGNVTIDLYPVFVANAYTVSYDANAEGAAGSTASSSHTYDAYAPLTANGFTREGYTFGGWSTNADGTGDIYTDGQMVSNLTIKNGVTVTLYAIWKEDASSDAAKSNSLLIEDEPPLATGTDAYSE